MYIYITRIYDISHMLYTCTCIYCKAKQKIPVFPVALRILTFGAYPQVFIGIFRQAMLNNVKIRIPVLCRLCKKKFKKMFFLPTYKNLFKLIFFPLNHVYISLFQEKHRVEILAMFCSKDSEKTV